MFQIYRTASGASRMDGEVQVALLLHSIDDACIDVYVQHIQSHGGRKPKFLCGNEKI